MELITWPSVVLMLGILAIVTFIVWLAVRPSSAPKQRCYRVPKDTSQAYTFTELDKECSCGKDKDDGI